MNNATEHYLWTMINAAGWYYWTPVALLAAWNLWGLYKLAAAETLLGRLIRICAITGFLLAAASIGNSALGLLWPPFVLLAFRGMTHQLYQACVRSGKIKKTEGSPSVRMASLLVEPK